MASGFGSRFVRAVFLSLLAAAAILVGGNGLLLIVQAFTRYVSVGSSGLQILFGLFQLALCPVALIAGGVSRYHPLSISVLSARCWSSVRRML
jgi:hypothetical protein